MFITMVAFTHSAIAFCIKDTNRDFHLRRVMKLRLTFKNNTYFS